MKKAVLLYLVFVLLGSALAIKHQVSQNQPQQGSQIVQNLQIVQRPSCVSSFPYFSPQKAQQKRQKAHYITVAKLVLKIVHTHPFSVPQRHERNNRENYESERERSHNEHRRVNRQSGGFEKEIFVFEEGFSGDSGGHPDD